MKHKILALLFVGTLCLAPAHAATYAVDPDHSTVSFKIKHLFSNVQGQFRKFEGEIQFEPDKPGESSAQGTIDATSIDTGVEQRDKHLRSADFFDVEKFPQIIFKTTKITDATKEHAKVEGLIAIHGVEKPITLDVEIHGVGKDPWGNVRAGFTAIGKINRKDFGLKWNEVLETGQLLVGEEVLITLELEAILKK